MALRPRVLIDPQAALLLTEFGKPDLVTGAGCLLMSTNRYQVWPPVSTTFYLKFVVQILTSACSGYR